MLLIRKAVEKGSRSSEVRKRSASGQSPASAPEPFLLASNRVGAIYYTVAPADLLFGGHMPQSHTAKRRLKTNSPTLSRADHRQDPRRRAHRFVRERQHLPGEPHRRSTRHRERRHGTRGDRQAAHSSRRSRRPPSAHPDGSGRLSNASGLVVSEQSDAAFLFGAFVPGLEVAGLTCLRPAADRHPVKREAWPMIYLPTPARTRASPRRLNN